MVFQWVFSDFSAMSLAESALGQLRIINTVQCNTVESSNARAKKTDG